MKAVSVMYLRRIIPVIVAGMLSAIVVFWVFNTRQSKNEVTLESTPEVLPTDIPEPTEEVMTEEVTVDVFNGSSIAGGASSMAEKVDALEKYTSGEVTNAGNQGYEETLLINLKKAPVAVLEKALNLEAITEIPDGETSDADVLIIVGADYEK